MESVAGGFLAEVTTDKLSRITLRREKGQSMLQVNRISGPFVHLPDLDGISYTFCLNLVYIQKETDTVTENSFNFGGIYILASVQMKLCIFRKLEDEKQQKQKNFLKSSTPQLWCKSSHTGSWMLVVFGGGGGDQFPGTQAAPRAAGRLSVQVV